VLAFRRFRSQRLLWLAPTVSCCLMIIFALAPTPGQWSDRHSQWLPDMLFLPLCAFVFFVGHRAFKTPGALTKALAISGWLWSGTILVGAVADLTDAQTQWCIRRAFQK